jgi:hypothetical protein
MHRAIRVLSLSLAVLIVVSSVAMGATKKAPHAAKRVAPQAHSMPAVTHEGYDSYHRYAFPDQFIGAGLNIGTVGTGFGFGVFGNVMFRVVEDQPIWVGGETGFLHAGTATGISEPTNTEVSGSINSIPILLSGLYELHIPEFGAAKPYVASSIGLSITPYSASATSGGRTFASVSETGVWFEFLLKPGVKYLDYFFELRLGFLKDQFLFLPTAGYTFRF